MDAFLPSPSPNFFIPESGTVTITASISRQESALLNPAQNQIVYLMFLNGLLFLGLNFVAAAIVFPGERGSKKLGYVLLATVGLVLCITQELDLLMDMEFPAGAARAILLGGFAAPMFLISLVYYRIKRSRQERPKPSTKTPGERNADH